MEKKCRVSLLLVVFIGIVCIGCTSVSGNVESAFSFSKPISVNNLIVGSFTYNINDTYVKLPNGNLVLSSFIKAESYPELYEEEVYYVTNQSTGIREERTRLRLIKDIIVNASYDELYSWAIRCAAESAGITHIIAIKSFLTTTTTNALGASVSRQDVTITVYGEVL